MFLCNPKPKPLLCQFHNDYHLWQLELLAQDLQLL
jgi:hypothetical protein